MFRSKLFSGYLLICLVLLVGSGCFVTKEKYRLKEMELAKTEKEYNALKAKTEEIKQQLAGLVKEKESLEAKYNTSAEEKKELRTQIDKLESQIKETEASLNEQKSKIDALKNERDSLANIILSIKKLVADVQGPEEKKVEKIHPVPQEQLAKDKVEKESESPPASKVKKEDEKPKDAAEAGVSSEEEGPQNQDKELPDQEPGSE
jgi:chromosome segregation ATPase